MEKHFQFKRSIGTSTDKEGLSRKAASRYDRCSQEDLLDEFENNIMLKTDDKEIIKRPTKATDFVNVSEFLSNSQISKVHRLGRMKRLS